MRFSLLLTLFLICSSFRPYLPVYFQGQMSSDFLQDLICTCKGKAVQVVVCVLSKDCLAPTFVHAKQVKYSENRQKRKGSSSLHQ
jgi:hypothetical protein